MPRNLRNTQPSYVALEAPFTGVNYAFGSRLDNALRTEWGQIVIDLATVTLAIAQTCIVGASYPKPPIATRRRATDLEASFVGAGALAALLATGVRLKRLKPRLARLSGLSQTRFITNLLPGINYAFETNAPTALQTACGQSTPTAAAIDLVYGCEYPKPARLRSLPPANDDVSGIETSWCTDAAFAAPPTGFAALKGSKTSLTDFIKALK